MVVRRVCYRIVWCILGVVLANGCFFGVGAKGVVVSLVIFGDVYHKGA